MNKLHKCLWFGIVTLTLGCGVDSPTGVPVLPDASAELGADTAEVTADSGLDAAREAAMDAPAPRDALAEIVTDVLRDAVVRCTSDTQCAGRSDGLGVCDLPSGSCVGCNVSPDTCMASEHCGASRMCVSGCHRDEGCASGAGGLTPRCLVSSHTCVECVTDKHCPLGRVCMGNVCGHGCSAAHACPMGALCCTGACVDTRSNPAHCGACGAMCSLANAMSSCTAGRCAVTGCAEGFGDCDTMGSNGCETDVRTATAHCGGCSMACPPRANSGVSCSAGACVYACSAGSGDCDGMAGNGCETDLLSTRSQCGACGRACVFAHAGATCALGVCVMGACEANFGDCDGMMANGCETGLSTVTHCGVCTTACAAVAGATASCGASGCGFVCSAGFGDCDVSPVNGCEVDLRASDAHCGMCGNGCRGASVCVAGVCAAMTNCRAIQARFPALPSGVYSIDPDGVGAGAAAFEVYCDMTTEGGGWTLVATAHNSPGSPSDTRRWNTESVFSDGSTFGTPAARATDDYKSPGWNTVTGTDVLVQTNEYFFGFRALLGSQGLGRFINTHPQWTATPCATAWIRSGVDFASSNLSVTARATLGLVLRGLDFNNSPSGCFPGVGPTRAPGGNENAAIGFAAGPGWWVFGMGNTPNGFDTWDDYDAGLFNLSRTNSQAATCDQATGLPGNYPCNANNRWTVGTVYDRSDKVAYVQMLVR